MRVSEECRQVDTAAAVDRAAFEARVLKDATAPPRILVAPWGEVRSAAGAFVVDEEAVRETIAAFDRHGTDLPVDYEHQTLGGSFSSPTGQAPAAGWIRALSAVTPAEASVNADAPEAGLWADVEWTDEAKAQLGERKYRYLSPVALIRREDRRMVGLHSAALTNKPAIIGMRPLVAGAADRAGNDAGNNAANDQTGGGLAAPSTAASAAERDDVVQRAQAAAQLEPVVGNASRFANAGDAFGQPDELSVLRRVLDMDESATEDIVVVAAAGRIRDLEAAETARRAAERVEAALSAGKLTSAQQAWAMTLAEHDPASFEAWEQSAPVVVPLGRLPSPDNAVATHGRRLRSVETAARAEWRANRAFLEGICEEAAFVEDAVRDAALN